MSKGVNFLLLLQRHRLASYRSREIAWVRSLPADHVDQAALRKFKVELSIVFIALLEQQVVRSGEVVMLVHLNSLLGKSPSRHFVNPRLRVLEIKPVAVQQIEDFRVHLKIKFKLYCYRINSNHDPVFFSGLGNIVPGVLSDLRNCESGPGVGVKYPLDQVSSLIRHKARNLVLRPKYFLVQFSGVWVFKRKVPSHHRE